ncbi:type VI secretion system lipoprotein TssJ [Paraburkholderia phenazinium]|jgi:type VI secretion system protein VasD|uniref:Type VI secretion system protein VasD n=1 Tax=Paraburkholderia phenazinium TaxID=60549 RepID=A0A1N6LIL2_9BURK|nr:type VI secretion system lipoprotein TssJ [Paraburkholderia phenazinium]SIO68662.1 type VI secretion system protein VasD [Paraburkholderia phenazinium]
MIKHTPRHALHLLGAAVLLSACAATPQAVPVPYDLYLAAGSQVNPDSRGRPAPILVGIYELKSTAAFDSGDFTALQDHAAATLGDDLVSFEQLILLPGEHKLMRRPGNPASRALGIVAGYRVLGKNVWKATVVLPEGKDTSAFMLWWSTPQPLRLQVKLDAGGLTATTTDWTH